jgi:pimeloyl-ACP methyl ester carboxylesterase
VLIVTGREDHDAWLYGWRGIPKIAGGHAWITVPVLVMHGDDDQIVPYADSGPLSAELVQNGTLKTYAGFPHGMPTTQAETINADLLEFIRS